MIREIKERFPVVLGFIKSGQSSLIDYLNCKKNEVAWRSDALDIYERCYDIEKHFPVFILRNPVDRCWSQYWYFKYNQKYTYSEFLDIEGVDGHGIKNPIEQCNYFKFIEKFKQHNPIILRLEDMQMISNFPIINKREHSVISEAFRRLTIRKLLNNNIRHGYQL